MHPVGRGGRRRGAAVPDRLQHQPRHRATSSSPSGSPGAIRESGGGLPKVQANGFFIEELGLRPGLDEPARLPVTPLWRVWETVRAEAAEDGVELAESELIGLAPLAAFLDVADHVDAPADAPIEERLAAAAAFLRLRDFSPLQALELRLDAAAVPATESPRPS